MFEGLRRLSSRLGAAQRFASRTLDEPTGDRILVLEGQPGLKPGAVAESLRAYGGGKLPFAAIVLDFHGADYHFSSDDLGALLAQAAFIAAVPPIDLLLVLVAGEAHARRVDDHHVIAVIEKWRPTRLVFALQQSCRLAGDAAQHLAVRVNDVPLPVL